MEEHMTDKAWTEMWNERTICDQCSQEYRDKQTGWTYHSSNRVFTCSEECREKMQNSAEKT